MKPIASAVVCGVLSAAIRLSAGAADAARPTLSRVVALPSPDRVSLVLELTDAVAHAELRAGAGSPSATIELGPVNTVAARELAPAADMNLVAGVEVGSFERSPDTFARVIVRLRRPCHQKLRVAGRRIYLDLVPAQSDQPASAPPRTSAPPPTSAPRPTSAPTPSVPAPSKSPVTPGESKGAVTAGESKSSATGDRIDAAYHALEADSLRRARALATQANVKALEALRAEVIRRDGQLGRKRPEVMSPLVDQIDRSTEEARALRLKLDGLLFRKP
jgi:hypothetical protein